MKNDIAHRIAMIQTDGYELNKPLVMELDGDPCVVAFYADLEGDVFPVEYGAEDMHILCTSANYLAVNADLLALISRNWLVAQEQWGKINQFWRDYDEAWVGWRHLLAAPKENVV